MTARRLALNLVLMAGFVCAQSDIKPEIRGTVTEPSLNIGIAGAEIALFEFLLDADKTVVRTQIATTSTDTRGEFRFPLDHFGQYFVETKKEGYSEAGSRADVDPTHPTQDRRFSLSQPGEITGRVVDEDGNLVAGQRIGIQGRALPSEMAPVTNPDGSFTSGKLAAGEYSIRMSPKVGDFETVTAQFTDDDLKIVDQDVDSTPSAPIPVNPGATSNVGTITVHRVPYYRAHVSLTGADCSPNENGMFSAIPKAPPYALRSVDVPCGKEFLVRNLKPGSYWFTFRTGRDGEAGKWALAEVDITRENVEVSMALAQTVDVNGRFIPADGVTLPKSKRFSVLMRGRLGVLLVNSAIGAADADGRFTVKNLSGLWHDVSVAISDARYSVKEIRYNGVATTDGQVRLAPGSPEQDLEIVLDDQAGVITVSVRDGDKPVTDAPVIVVKWPYTEGDMQAGNLTRDNQGRFRISGLAPGEYRVMALKKGDISQLLNRAEKVTVERGTLKDISLKLIDPSQ
jgi:hypothetical protein